MGRGRSEYSAVRRKHSAQRFTMALRAVSLRFVRFYAFSRLRRESPRVLLWVMRICYICSRFPFLIACKRREYSMNCDFLIWWFPEKILILPSEKPHPVCGSLFHFLVLRRPSYFPLTPRSVSTVTARVRAENRLKYIRRYVAIEAEKIPQAERRANVPRETFPVPVSTTAQRRVERCLRHTHSARTEGRKHRESVDQFEHLLHDLLVEQMVVGQ